MFAPIAMRAEGLACRGCPTSATTRVSGSSNPGRCAVEEGSAGPAQGAANPKLAEFDLLTSGELWIGHDGPSSFLFAETVDRDRLGLTAPWGELLRGVIRVHRLREITCLYGFTRLEPPPTSAESDLDEIQIAVDGADLARSVEWLPAVEQFGEGIFLHIAPESLKT